MRLPLLTACVALAGCLAAPDLAPASPAALLRFDGLVGATVTWAGGPLRGADDGPADLACAIAVPCAAEAPCEPASCERRSIELLVAADRWAEREGALEVRVQTRSVDVALVDVRVRDASGAIVARGAGLEGLVAVLPEPAPGAYSVEVVAARGNVTFLAAALVVERAREPDGATPRDLLPDLVALPASDFHVEYPGAHGQGPWPVVLGPEGAALRAAGARGCGADEVVEDGARRCLRMTLAVGNAGDGPLELFLSNEEVAPALRFEGEFVQRVHRSDGSVRDVPAGEGGLHVVHQHLHYDALAEVRVHAWDGARGEEVARSGKVSFCILDVGILDVTAPRVAPFAFGPNGCFDQAGNGGWRMGISPGWFDSYHWHLNGQYVEVSHLTDGTYEVVVVANPNGTITEAAPENNEATVLIRIEGDRVEVVGEA